MSSLQINTRVRRLFAYLEDFERGKIQVPPFQRDFVWNNERKLDLLDSLKNGFPIGSVLFWQADSENSFDILDSELQTVGTYKLPANGYEYFFILDGYQRLSTLFGCFIDPTKTSLIRDEIEWKKNFDIVYNLNEDKFEFNRKTRSEIEIFQIPLYHFIDGEKFYDYQTALMNANIPEEKRRLYINRYKNFGSKISGYDIPSIDLVGGTIKEAIEIFSRLNSRGQSISDDWKVSALSFSREENFRFGSEIDELFTRLERYNFFKTVEDRRNKRELILQCVSNSFGKVYFDFANLSKQLEEMALRPDFVEVSRKVFDSIEKAVKFLNEELLVLESKLLPYNNQLIFIADFFNKIDNPNQFQLEKLKKWFWITTYSNYFTIYNLSKQRQAYFSFQDFISDPNTDPIFYDKERRFDSIEFPKKISMGSVRAKALALFMLNYSVKYDNILRGNDQPHLDSFNYQSTKIFNYTFPATKEKSSENLIYVVNPAIDLGFMKNTEDLLFYIMDNYSSSSNYFINRNMVNEYLSTSNMDNFLSARLENIKQAEREFVESLNISYND